MNVTEGVVVDIAAGRASAHHQLNILSISYVVKLSCNTTKINRF